MKQDDRQKQQIARQTAKPKRAGWVGNMARSVNLGKLAAETSKPGCIPGPVEKLVQLFGRDGVRPRLGAANASNDSGGRICVAAAANHTPNRFANIALVAKPGVNADRDGVVNVSANAPMKIEIFSESPRALAGLDAGDGARNQLEELGGFGWETLPELR